MNRLTMKHGEGLYESLDPIDVLENKYSRKNYKKLTKRLGEYEDLDEQGKLLKLPCAVGDIVYRINEGARNPIIGMVITEIRYKALRNGKTVIKLILSDDMEIKTNGSLTYYTSEIGEKIFLTQEEAEAALKEIASRILTK